MGSEHDLEWELGSEVNSSCGWWIIRFWKTLSGVHICEIIKNCIFVQFEDLIQGMTF